MQPTSPSFFSVKHSGPFSAMNSAIWSPSLWHTKFSRFSTTSVSTFLSRFSFSDRQGDSEAVKFCTQSRAVFRLRQYLKDLSFK